MPILITGASNAQAYKLERLLNEPDVIFADDQDNSHLKYAGKKIVSIPPGNSSSYAHEVLKACLDLGITKIYPLYLDEIKAFAEANQLFTEYGIKVIAPGFDFVKKLDSATVTATGEFVIVEEGQVVAGKLPPNFNLPQSLLTGIFSLDTDNQEPEIKLFAIHYA
jgi:hypothetical protein